MRIAAGLLLLGVAGFALASRGGGGGASTRTDLSVTRTLETRTVTNEVTTTTPGATTTTERVHIRTQTETVPVTVPAATTSATSSSSSTPWGWIALGLGVAAVLLIVFLLWHRHRAGAADWGAKTADLNRRSLVALDDVLAKGSLVTGQVEALASEARSLEANAPDDPSRAAAANVRGRLDELAATLERDRALRLGSPPPSEEQLTYSSALIRQQAEQLQGALRPPSAGQQTWA